MFYSILRKVKELQYVSLMIGILVKPVVGKPISEYRDTIVVLAARTSMG